MRVGICSRIVARFNTWWAFLGWTFFIGSYLLQFGPGTLLPLAGLCFLMMIVWCIHGNASRETGNTEAP